MDVFSIGIIPWKDWPLCRWRELDRSGCRWWGRWRAGCSWKIRTNFQTSERQQLRTRHRPPILARWLRRKLSGRRTRRRVAAPDWFRSDRLFPRWTNRLFQVSSEFRPTCGRSVVWISADKARHFRNRQTRSIRGRSYRWPLPFFRGRYSRSAKGWSSTAGFPCRAASRPERSVEELLSSEIGTESTSCPPQLLTRLRDENQLSRLIPDQSWNPNLLWSGSCWAGSVSSIRRLSRRKIIFQFFRSSHSLRRRWWRWSTFVGVENRRFSASS